MKHLKRLISIVLLASMLVLLSGCVNYEQAIIGSWAIKLDMTETVVSQMDIDSITGGETEADFELVFDFEFEFTEEKTVVVTLARETAGESFTSMVTFLTNAMVDNVLNTYIEEGYVEEDARAAFETETGMPLEEFVNSMIDMIFTDEMIEGMCADLEKTFEGLTYAIDGNKLYLIAGDETLEYLTESESYIEIKISGNTLTFVNGYGENASEEVGSMFAYPCDLTRVTE
ncbi:MAG: hypothetical protein IJA35_00280 [Clostridia bacterium]|nr:hypothetical protein [Clostridia bacterium]